MAGRDIFYKGESKGILEMCDCCQDLLEKSWFVDFHNRTRGSEYFRIARNATKVERLAGESKCVKAHQEVWERHNGKIPEGFSVDHLDFSTLNNKITNLALVSKFGDTRRKKSFQAPVAMECSNG